MTPSDYLGTLFSNNSLKTGKHSVSWHGCCAPRISFPRTRQPALGLLLASDTMERDYRDQRQLKVKSPCVLFRFIFILQCWTKRLEMQNTCKINQHKSSVTTSKLSTEFQKQTQRAWCTNNKGEQRNLCSYFISSPFGTPIFPASPAYWHAFSSSLCFVSTLDDWLTSYWASRGKKRVKTADVSVFVPRGHQITSCYSLPANPLVGLLFLSARIRPHWF